jgi:hypothetical protein
MEREGPEQRGAASALIAAGNYNHVDQKRGKRLNLQRPLASC